MKDIHAGKTLTPNTLRDAAAVERIRRATADAQPLVDWKLFALINIASAHND